MKKYVVTIEEVVSEEFVLEADSLDKAIEKTIANYNEGSFVLEPGNLIETNILIKNEENNESSDWFEL